jgi:hypothetical protein
MGVSMTERFNMLYPLLGPMGRAIGVALVLHKAHKAVRAYRVHGVDAVAIPSAPRQAHQVATVGLPGFFFDARWDRHALLLTFRGAVGNHPAP